MFYHSDILAILEKLDPDSILAIFPNAEQVLREYADQHATTRIETAGDSAIGNQLELSHRYRLALVAETLEFMCKSDAETLLSRLRDLYSEILYVIVPIGGDQGDHKSTWRHTDMLALAFRLAGKYRVNDMPFNLYHYDIYDYKHTPDWLNSQYWANPEMWNKARW